MNKFEVFKTVDALNLIADDPEVKEETRKAAKEAAGTVARWTIPDTKVYRIVVWVLGIVALMTVAGGIALAFVPNSADLPQAVVSIGSAAVGALAGLLAPSPGGDG